MNNSNNSASPTASQVSPKEKQNNSSYWLSPEELEELRKDAQRSKVAMRAMMQKYKQK